jgi:DUF3037 family protein
MAHCYKFALIRLAPDDTRDERINIGIVVVTDDGLDVRVSRRLEKTHAISAALTPEALRELVQNLKGLDERLQHDGMEADARLELLARVGPLSLSKAGTFDAGDLSAYEERIGSIMKALVEPEPALPRIREKRSKLLTQVKAIFRQERVLAKKDETLDSHRIVPSYQLDQGLVADLVLRNGAVHVVETVDATGSEGALRKAIGDIGISALVLERARMKFGDKTHARLVYNASSALENVARPSLDAAAHQGAELTNWGSANDRHKFIHALASLATPIEANRRGRLKRFEGRR